VDWKACPGYSQAALIVPGLLHRHRSRSTVIRAGRGHKAETKAIIAATPVTGTETYLLTSCGKAFTANGFGNKMRE
jgi:hypothetical protein